MSAKNIRNSTNKSQRPIFSRDDIPVIRKPGSKMKALDLHRNDERPTEQHQGSRSSVHNPKRGG